MRIADTTEPSRSCPAWATPSPSQRPMDPPRSERRVDRWNGRKSVVVTFIVLEKIRLIDEKLSFIALSVTKRTSV